MNTNLSIEIEVVNWNEYNPRKDLRHPWWFACANGLFDDPDFAEFSPEEIAFWIYILCMASKKCGKNVLIKEAHYKQKGFKNDTAKSAISKLIMCTAIRTGGWGVPVPTEQNTTEQNTTKQTKQIPSLPFGQIYEIYPRKVGKSDGFKKLAKEVKTPEEFEALTKAVTHFADHHRKEGTSAQYIPHFSTWVSTWRDWLDPQTGTSSAPAEARDTWAEQAARVLDGIKRHGTMDGASLHAFLGEELWRIAIKVDGGLAAIRQLPANQFTAKQVAGMLKESAARMADAF